MIVADPRATAVTNPELDTVATTVFEEDHEACAVTFEGSPVETVAVAVSWLFPPIRMLDVPVTDRAVLVGDVVVLPLHEASIAPAVRHAIAVRQGVVVILDRTALNTPSTVLCPRGCSDLRLP